jgi:hypothetical protein
MAQTIKLRRSSTSGAVPTTSSLSLGEVAINTYDGKMYIKKNDGSDAIVELSGDKLPLSGGTLTGTLNFGDNVRARFGASNDLQIYHTTTGNHSIIAESGSGNLILAADNLEINNAANNENKIVATSDGAVTLYFNNVSKFATQSYGALVSGVLLANDGSQSAPAFSFSNDSNTGMYRNSADILGFATGGARRGYFASSGIHSDSNVYSGTGGEFRNYAGTWRASTGVTGNGFTFVNSVDGTALTLTSTGAATFAGSVTSTGLTASGTLTQFNTYNSASTLLGINIVSDAGSTSYTHPYLDFRRWTGTGTNHYTASIEVAPTNADANAIVFMSDTKSTNTKATTERMRIDSSGNLRVGVGNTFEPVLQFTGSGRAQANPGFTFNGDLDTGMFNPSTQNTIAFATGGTEKMRITSAGFVGIGTTNPLDLLYIKSSNTDARLVLDAAAGADPELKFFEAGNVKHTVGYDAATSKFVIGTDNVDTGKRFTINSSGAITFNEAFTFPTADGSANQLLKTDGSGNMSWVTVAGVGNATIISDADNDTKIQVEESADEDKIRFDTAGSERMIIDATGKVGIGTTSPQSKLDVNLGNNETASIGGTISVGTYAGLRFGYSEAGNSNYRHSAIVFERDDAAFGDARGNIHILNSPSGSASADLGDARLTILPSGNVGIGTSSPVQKFQVDGSIYSNGGEIYVNTNKGITAVGNLIFKANDGTNYFEGMRLASTGNVGIGTSSPGAKLSIHSSVGADPHTGDASLELRDTGALAVENGGSIIFSAVYTGTSGYLGSGPYIKAYKLNATDGDYSYGLKFATRENGVGAQVVGLTIAPDQNVGIGTTVPTSKLHIMTASNGASTVGTASDELILENSADCGLTIRSGSSDDGVISFADADDHNVGQVYYSHSNNSMTFRTNDSTAMTVTSAGNLGIGTTAAAQKLHVVGSAIIDGGTGVASTGVLNVRQSGDTLNNGIALTSSHGTSHRIWKDSAGKLNFGPTSLPSAFVQDLTGNVGIGTTSPYYKLDTRFSNTNTTLSDGSSGNWGSNGIRIDNTNTTVGAMALAHFRVGDADWHIGNKRVGTDQADFIFANEGVTKMLIDHTGNVGIGTTSPAGNLHIKSTGNVGDALLIVEADNDNDVESDNPRIELRQDGNFVTGSIYVEGEAGQTATNSLANTLVLDSKGAASNQGIQFAVSGRAAAQSGGETSSIVAMTILGANRNVGIGTSSPDAKLRIDQDVGTVGLKVTGGSGGTNIAQFIRDVGGNASVSINASGGDPQIQFVSAGNTFALGVNSNTFEIADNSSLGTNTRFSITNTGNVGIGITNPGRKLTVQGATGDNLPARFIGGANTTHGSIEFQDPTTTADYKVQIGSKGDALYFQAGGSEKARLDSSGRLLLNATSTAFGDKLYVNGDAYVTGGWRTGTGATFVGELTNSSGILTLQSAANRDIQLGDTNNPDIVYVDTSTENVGIGTTAPATTLHVTNSTTNAEVMRLTTTGDDPDRHMYFQSDHIYGSGNMYWGTGAYLNIFRASSHRFYYGTSNTEAMRVHTNGNISIGANTSPVYRLVVSNGNAAGIEFGPEYATDANLIQHYDRTASQYMDVNHIAQNHRFSRGASEWMRINSSGNVGIGTTSPTNTDYGSLNPKLHVKQSNTTGAFNLVARFEAGGDANETGGAILINHSNDRGMLIEGGRDGSGSVADDDGVGHLGILNSGGAHTRMITLRQNMVGASNVYNVGIGTTDPQAQLQIKQLGINVNQSSVSSTSQYTCDSMSATIFRSARYTIQITNVTDSTYHLTEMLLIHDGTTPSISEFGTIFTGSAAEAVFTADISSGNVRLLATPASTDNMQFKVVRHSILV